MLRRFKGRTIIDNLQLANSAGYVRRQAWTNPVAVDADRLLNDAADATTHTTFLAQPDFARQLTIVASDTGTEEVVFNGTNIRGETITETVALNGTTPVATTKAFKTVTSVVIPVLASNATCDVGVNDGLGLDRCMSEAAVLDTYQNGTRETTAATVSYHATDVSKNTVNPNTALDATKDFTVVYVATEVTTNSSTSA